MLSLLKTYLAFLEPLSACAIPNSCYEWKTHPSNCIYVKRSRCTLKQRYHCLTVTIHRTCITMALCLTLLYFFAVMKLKWPWWETHGLTSLSWDWPNARLPWICPTFWAPLSVICKHRSNKKNWRLRGSDKSLPLFAKSRSTLKPCPRWTLTKRSLPCLRWLRSSAQVRKSTLLFLAKVGKWRRP